MLKSLGEHLRRFANLPMLIIFSNDHDIPMNGMVSNYKNGLLVTCLGIPMIYGINIVHVHNNVYKAICFPHNVGLRVTRDPLLINKIGAATALEISQNHY
ncbi:hypothetical protein CTI12_AA497450 [Artemisia annua]|uniref:Uncharacterized protein n=1 Tax=Artemisia annua TaxID=35608 RepID=A0A2U1LFT3_ARTAN|nr:hypothetical protein CTI12_AA497450 [Artemisia annua]